MEQADESEFLDLLYSAVTQPERWAAVLESLADLIGGSSVWLSRVSVVDGSGTGIIARIDPRMTDAYNNHYAGCNPLNNVTNADDYWRDWRPRILTDEDWMPKDDLLRSEYYNDFLQPQDIHTTMMIRLAAYPPETCVININRPKSRGPYERSDIERVERLHCDLIRAFDLGQKFSHLETLNQNMAAALNDSAHGVFMLDETGTVRHANHTAAQLVGVGGALRLAGGRLSAATVDGARRIEGLVAAAACADRSARRAGSITLPAGKGLAPVTVTAVPQTIGPETVFSARSAVMVSVSDPNLRATADVSLLRRRFGFTPAETRVALALGEGASPRQAAARLGVSFHTIRHQLQSIYEKAGVNRQAELVLMLARVLQPS